MFAVQVDAQNRVIRCDVMTKAMFVQHKLDQTTTWFFVDRTSFLDQTDINTFMQSPGHYFLDENLDLKQDPFAT